MGGQRRGLLQHAPRRARRVGAPGALLGKVLGREDGPGQAAQASCPAGLCMYAIKVHPLPAVGSRALVEALAFRGLPRGTCCRWRCSAGWTETEGVKTSLPGAAGASSPGSSGIAGREPAALC